MAESGTVTVILRLDFKPFLKAVEEARLGINALFEAYMRTLPWYKRWPIRARIWWRIHPIKRWYDRQVWYPLW